MRRIKELNKICDTISKTKRKLDETKQKKEEEMNAKTQKRQEKFLENRNNLEKLKLRDQMRKLHILSKELCVYWYR